MTPGFKSQYSEHDAFYLRGDLLRSAFGNWDACDPVAHCILDLVEARHKLADYSPMTRISRTSRVQGRGQEAPRSGRKADARTGGTGQLADPEMGQRTNQK